MNVSEFLFFLHQKGITVHVERENLMITAPEGSLSPEIQKVLREEKAEIIAFLSEAKAVSNKSNRLRHVDRSQSIPAAASQKGLWFQYQLEGPSSTYNVPHIYRMSGSLNIPALEKSLQYLIKRHESLRMSFESINGEPYIVIKDNVKWGMDTHRVSGGSIERELAATAAMPFSLEKAPLFRAHLWTDYNKNHTLLLNFHHIIMDEWTKGIIRTRDLTSICRDCCRRRSRIACPGTGFRRLRRLAA